MPKRPRPYKAAGVCLPAQAETVKKFPCFCKNCKEFVINFLLICFDIFRRDDV